MSSKAQKAAIQQVRSVVECSEKVATDLLKAHGWDAEAAISAFYEAPAAAAPAAAARKGVAAAAAPSESESKLDAEFKRFEDPATPGCITMSGIEQLGSELGIDVYSDAVTLMIMFNMQASTQGVIKAAEWRKGMLALRCDSVSALKAKLPDLRVSLRACAASHMREFWAWAYKFNCDEGQKSLKMEAVIALTEMLLTPAQWPLSPLWLDFLRGVKKGTVSLDTWTALPRFIAEIRPDFSNHSEDYGWPVQLDEFAEFAKKRLAEK